MNAQLGLWLSPSSGYGTAQWGVTAGYAGDADAGYRGYLCQAGEKYRRDIVKVCTDLARKYNLAFWKFDGFSASCPGPGLLPGPFTVEANVDAFIELLTEVRKVRRDVYLDPTCGMWLSPWWLKFADSIWGNVSSDYPEPVVPAPIVRDSATTTRDEMFRRRCREHPGYPPAAIEHLGVIVISPEKWTDNAMIVLGRGCRLLTLYINPKHFLHEEQDWAFLAAMLKWARHNAPTLQNTELILGDPFERQPYGYAHFRGPRGILAIRNPFVVPQTVSVKLDESSGWSPQDGQTADRSFFVRIVYPRLEVLPRKFRYGDAMQLELQAYETVVAHVEPLEGPVLLGGCYRETRREAGRAVYEVFGRAGRDETLLLAGSPRATKALVDGRDAALSLNEEPAKLRVAFPGRELECAVEGGEISVETSPAGWRFVGQCNAEAPPGVKATMHLLCDPQRMLEDKLQCAAQINGQAVEVRAIQSLDRPTQVHQKHAWSWFEFDLPAGRSEVCVAMKPAEHGLELFRGKVGWWLWAEHPLEKRTVTFEFDRPPPAGISEPLPLPVNMDRQRQIRTIQPLTEYRAGNRWWKLDQATVWLDQSAPDEVVQEYGSLAVNQSYWRKEMIIAGRKFARGLGAHANSRIVYELAGGDFQRFRCLVGRDEHAVNGRVVFQVWVDQKKVFDSGPMDKTAPAQSVDVDVSGAKLLELRTLDGGDGISGDHGDWADAQLVR